MSWADSHRLKDGGTADCKLRWPSVRIPSAPPRSPLSKIHHAAFDAHI
jgi:hypothetical protein